MGIDDRLARRHFSATRCPQATICRRHSIALGDILTPRNRCRIYREHHCPSLPSGWITTVLGPYSRWFSLLSGATGEAQGAGWYVPCKGSARRRALPPWTGLPRSRGRCCSLAVVSGALGAARGEGSFEIRAAYRAREAAKKRDLAHEKTRSHHGRRGIYWISPR